jgi:hypothetical protein
MADQEDEKLIDIVEKHNKDAADIMELLEQASGNITFPITNAKQMIDALGGPGVKVKIGDKDIPLGSLMGKVPNYYFPIMDESEMIAKLADLTLRQPGPGTPLSDAARTQLMPAQANSPGHGPPNVSHKEVDDEAKKHPGLGAGGKK